MIYFNAILLKSPFPSSSISAILVYPGGACPKLRKELRGLFKNHSIDGILGNFLLIQFQEKVWPQEDLCSFRFQTFA
jgi:hypothetical protein